MLLFSWAAWGIKCQNRNIFRLSYSSSFSAFLTPRSQINFGPFQISWPTIPRIQNTNTHTHWFRVGFINLLRETLVPLDLVELQLPGSSAMPINEGSWELQFSGIKRSTASSYISRLQEPPLHPPLFPFTFSNNPITPNGDDFIGN